MQKVSPSVANDVRSLDREGAVEASGITNWHSAVRAVPDRPWVAPERQHATDAHVYFDGDESFSLHLAPAGGAEFVIWTSAEGLEAVIASCQAALVRARIERDVANAAAEYRYLADLFREGHVLSAPYRAALHAHAVRERNYLLAEQTA